MGGGSPSSTTSTTKNELDPTIKAWTQQNYNVANAINNQPYKAYSASQRISPLTPLQNQGIAMGSQAASANLGMGTLNQGVAAAAAAGNYDPQQVSTGTWNANAAKQYMSPYTQSVINATNAQIDRNLAQTQQGTDAAAVTQGAYGGTRQAVATSMNDYNANQLKAQTAAQLNDQAYANAQSMFSADQARQLQAAQANQSAGLQAANLGLGSADLLGRLGLSQQGLAQANAQALLGYGGVQQGQNQQVADWNYQQFADLRDWNLRGLSALESAVSGVPYSTSQATTTPVYHNKTAGALGGAATGASMGSAFGPWGTAIGAVGGGLMGYFSA